MKRNLILLTAVVVAAVLLAGCTWPVIGNAIKIDVVNAKNEDGKVLIKPTNLAKEYKKESVVKITFEYTEDWEDEKIEFTFEPKGTDLKATELPPEGEFRGGYEVAGQVGKKKITITTSVEAPEEQ